jgi:hypothetical protein
VSRHDVAPVEFSHAKLFVPKPKPAEPQVALNGATDGANVRLAQMTSPDAANDANATPPVETTPLAVEITPAPTPTVEGTPTGTVTPIQVEAAPAPAEVTPAAAAPAPTEAAPADGFVKPAPAADPAKPVVPRVKGAEQPQKRAGQVAVFVSRKEKKIFVRQGMVPLFDMPITIDNPDQPLGTHVYTALQVTDDGAGMRWNLMTVPTDAVAMSEERGGGRRHSREAAKPVVSMPAKAASSATEALNRIQFPKEAVDRISEILIPGSSLVVSDTGISGETGKGTDFIVLTR